VAGILIVDDDEYIRGVLTINAQELDHFAASAMTLSEGLLLMEKDPFDLVFLDVRLPDGNGLEAIRKFREMRHAPEVIIITGAGEAEGAALAIQSGAWDYMEKPFTRKETILQITRALEFRSKKTEIGKVVLERGRVVGNSSALKGCLDQVAHCVGNDVNVLLTGETGTGKELLAQTIHENSKRSTEPFVVVDCTALPENLIESILFGHVKGAFTSAAQGHEGLIAQAHGGVLFLDEVGEMPLSAQRRFLRVLQERRFRPIGGKQEQISDFRLISATNKNLNAMAKEGTFRDDLLFRLCAFQIEVPPLRNRTGDVQQLIQHYLSYLCIEHGIAIKGFVPEFLGILGEHDWPGNVRELINVLEEAILSDPENPTLYPMHLPKGIRIKYAQSGLLKKEQTKIPREKDNAHGTHIPDLGEMYGQSPPPMAVFRETVINEMEAGYLRHIMTLTGNNVKEACKISELSPSRLYTLLKKHGIPSK
jgi:two-component system, NtrC family, response regulator